MEEGVIVKWRKKEGEFVKAGDTLFEIATDKATVEHNALDPGYLRQILVKEGGGAIVNEAVAIFTEKAEESIAGYVPEGAKRQVLVAVEVAPTAADPRPLPQQKTIGQPSFVPEPPLAAYTFPTPEEEIGGRLAASPLAKKLASEGGIDLSTVKGTGPHGRIVARDLPLGQPDAAVTFGRRETPTLPPGSYEEEPLSPMRRVIAQRLQESKSYIPHFYVSQDIDVEPLSRQRQELSTVGLKLSFNDFILRAAALSLREHPRINSGFHSVNQTVIRFKTIDIAVAVSVPEGLITPIVRHADFKNIGQISQEVKWLAGKAKEGTLKPEEYKGGSFTVSNLGMYGISEFSAIINPPQAAILAVGGISDRPVIRDGAIVLGKTLRLTLSADHRVVDGADGAKFLKTLQKYLEAPALLLL